MDLFLQPPDCLILSLPVVWHHRDTEDPNQAIRFILFNRSIAALCPGPPFFDTEIR